MAFRRHLPLVTSLRRPSNLLMRKEPSVTDVEEISQPHRLSL